MRGILQSMKETDVHDVHRGSLWRLVNSCNCNPLNIANTDSRRRSIGDMPKGHCKQTRRFPTFPRSIANKCSCSRSRTYHRCYHQRQEMQRDRAVLPLPDLVKLKPAVVAVDDGDDAGALQENGSNSSSMKGTIALTN